MEVLVDNIDNHLCSGLYQKGDDSLVPWQGTEPDAKINCVTRSKEDND